MASPVIQVRITDTELSLWMAEQCKKRKMTRSQFVRYVLQRAMVSDPQRGPRPVTMTSANSGGSPTPERAFHGPILKPSQRKKPKS